MGRQQDWSLTAYVFLFLSLTSQIHCTRKGGISSSGDTRHFNVIRRESVPSLNQQELKEKDLIQRLSGQPTVTFKQYGGYVAVNETAGRFFYYYFVEAIKPNSSPLVLWLNGEPGCSTLGRGALMEHGPFRVHSDGKTLLSNPYSWNNEVNVLYVESPAQVGFSYTNTPSDLENQGDKMAAEDNYMFLVKWLERFPEYKGREIYFAGQSYAGGHFVPQLAQIVLQRSNQNSINLRGVLLGNPKLDQAVEVDGVYDYLLGHALISHENMDEIKRVCPTGDSKKTINNDECLVAKKKIDDQIKYLDHKNIYADVCLNPTLTRETTTMEFDPCSEYYVKAYLNTAQAQEAMHVKPTKWEHCNNVQVTNKWSSDDSAASMLPILQELMAKGIRVWVYSGDLDSTVPMMATWKVMRKMNLTVENTWSAWFTEGQVGGYTQVFKGNVTFATVRGSGQNVASDQPIRALTLFTSFIRNTLIPRGE